MPGFEAAVSIPKAAQPAIVYCKARSTTGSW